ncbi:MAG: hypothetical protein SCALA702_09920 [Melioribacteraceae bacterium]|nr:MAG: hypothetical protein SCALA702_09920 [Melioribacteraceae bacterium]
MSIISKILSSAKKMRDVTIPAAAVPILNHLYGDFGEVLNLKIDSEEKKLFVEVLLKGEKETVWLEVINYELTEEEGTTFLKFSEIKASREWLDLLVNVFAEKTDYKVEVPADAAKIAKLLI